MMAMLWSSDPQVTAPLTLRTLLSLKVPSAVKGASFPCEMVALAAYRAGRGRRGAFDAIAEGRLAVNARQLEGRLPAWVARDVVNSVRRR